MANGTTAHQNISAVKASCNSLEVSPSCHTSSSPIYASGGHTVKQPKHPNKSKTHAGSRGHTKEMPTKFKTSHHKRGH